MWFSKSLWHPALHFTNDRKMEKSSMNYKKVFEAILTDLSKAFDWILQDLPVVKLDAGLPPQRQAENRIWYILYHLGGNFIWRPTRFNFGTTSVHYFLVWPLPWRRQSLFHQLHRKYNVTTNQLNWYYSKIINMVC